MYFDVQMLDFVDGWGLITILLERNFRFACFNKKYTAIGILWSWRWKDNIACLLVGMFWIKK